MVMCIGAGQLSLLGIRKQDLLVTEINLSVANSTGINIVGVTFLKLKGVRVLVREQQGRWCSWWKRWTIFSCPWKPVRT